MTTLLEASRLALEALELSHPRFGVGTAIHIKAVATLRQAIEQAQQAEPVAWQCAECGGFHLLCPHGNKDVPVYTAPPPRQPLTDEEIENIANSNLCVYSFARAIEAAHGIKGEA